MLDGFGRRRLAAWVVAAAGSCVGATTAVAQDNPAYLQWFETSWSNIELRTPDLFMAGYSALWLPPPCKASDGSVGYDVFDRFDLGSPEGADGVWDGGELPAGDQRAARGGSACERRLDHEPQQRADEQRVVHR
ncbi:MAG: hypothetical protein QM783_09070 [Phycisphaerales bacterium]